MIPPIAPEVAFDQLFFTGTTDIDGADLFALVGALAWLGDQPSLAPRADHLFGVIASAILTNRASSDV